MSVGVNEGRPLPSACQCPSQRATCVASSPPARVKVPPAKISPVDGSAARARTGSFMPLETELKPALSKRARRETTRFAVLPPGAALVESKAPPTKSAGAAPGSAKVASERTSPFMARATGVQVVPFQRASLPTA